MLVPTTFLWGMNDIYIPREYFCKDENSKKTKIKVEQIVYNKCILRAGVFYFFCIARDEKSIFRFLLDSVTYVCDTFMHIPFHLFLVNGWERLGDVRFFLSKLGTSQIESENNAPLTTLYIVMETHAHSHINHAVEGSGGNGPLFCPYLVQTWKGKTTNFPLPNKLVQKGFSEAPAPTWLALWKLLLEFSNAIKIITMTYPSNMYHFFRYFRAHYQCHSFGPKNRLALWSGPCHELPPQHRWWSFLEENLFQALLWHQKRNVPQTEHRDPWKYGVCQSGDILVRSYFQGKKVGRLGRFHRFTKFWGMHCIEAPNRWNIE